jgi:hypothetical protein
MDLARRSFGFILAALAILASKACALPAPADTLLGYELGTPPSDFRWGCFPPCLCPAPAETPLTGTFRLVRRGRPDPTTQVVTYDVTNLRWNIAIDGRSIAISGEGVYTFTPGSTPTDRLTLDLAFDGEPRKRFDSGSHAAEAAFPEIRTRLSLHGEHCRDSVLVVQAHPLGAVKPAPRAARSGGRRALEGANPRR